MTSSTPIGSIVVSLLDYDKFIHLAAASEQIDEVSLTIPPAPPLNPKKTLWVPADGRTVSGSGYHRLTGHTNVPDLRGLFLRGLNNFDQAWTTPPQDAGQLDPDGTREAGSYQTDTFKEHRHSFKTRVPSGVPGGSGEAGNTQGLDYEAGVTDPSGGAETRSKNAAVAYYVRIN